MDRGFDLDINSGDGEKWTNFGYIFKVKAIGFAGKSDMWYERC